MNDRIQEVLPLAPGQGGILFHSLGDAAGGVYVIQIVLDIVGEPEPEREAAAWQSLAARHDALRTAFVWQGQKRPLQVIGRRARVRVTTRDLGHLAASEQETHFQDWLRQDRVDGFDLTRAPLLRAGRFRLGPGRHRIVATFHHAALDGWSIPVLLRDWIDLYAGRPLPPALPIRDYIAWAHAQDRNAALAFWRAELAGRETQARLALAAPATPPEDPRGDVSLVLSAAETAALSASARRRGLTLATATQGAWAVVMARAAGAREALYGLARAGRPAALTGVERRVGMFLNTLPMRADVPEDAPFAEWLGRLQARQVAQGAYEHAALADVQAAAGRRPGAPLLESAVVFENYPTDPSLLGEAPDFSIGAVEVLEQTSLPLTLFATVRDGLALRLLYDAAAIDAAAARLLLEDVRQALAALAERPEAPIAEIVTRTETAKRGAPRRTAEPVAPPPADDDVTADLARIWSEVLGIEPPGIDDNFFDLGGHSILVITLQDRIRRDLGIDVEIPDLFRFATLKAQSGHVARRRSGAGAAIRVDAARVEARAAGSQRLRQRRAQTQAKDRTNVA